MKLLYLLFVLLPLCLCSCSKEYDCESRIISEVSFYNRPDADSFAKVIRCEKGSDFAKRIDSTYEKIWDKVTSTYLESYIGYSFSDVPYEYIIVLLPSGKTHMVKDINYGHETYTYGFMTGGGSGSDPRISCSYGYTLDGKVVTYGAKQFNQAGTHAYIDL